MRDLPTIVSDIDLAGNGATLDFSGRSSTKECLLVDAGSLSLDSITIANCGQEPLYFQGGSNHSVSNSTFVNNAKSIGTTQSTSGTIIGPNNSIIGGTTHAVFVNGPGDWVIDNTFSETGGPGGSAIFVGGTGDGATIIGNLIVRSHNGIAFSSNGDNVNIWYNTIVSSAATGIVVGQAVGINIQNNIISHSGMFGINTSSDNVGPFDYNLWFNTTDCNGCAMGLGANSKQTDPLYNDFAGDDFTLDTSTPSPAVEAGTDSVNQDRNGGAATNFNGVAPDMGYWESP